MTRIAYVSTYVPKKCGIATFAYHLRQAVQQAKRQPESDPVVVLTDNSSDLAHDPLLWPLHRDKADEYRQMAQRINQSDVDVVSLQHEFGIFGGEAGAHILSFIHQLKKPLVTTFHTVFSQPQQPYSPIQQEIAEKSTKIVVMNRLAIRYLHDTFGVPVEKIHVIPHGTPTPAPEKRAEWRKALQWEGRKVLMTFGLLSRGKGLERILDILPMIVKRVPNVLYAIVGQTHPEVKKHEGERYRQELREQIERNGLEQHVVMIDRYLEEVDLVRHLTACDVYITPYPGLQQITSGTLAYAVGLGRPVLTTPYAYAADLLADDPELLLTNDDHTAWIEPIATLLADERKLDEWSRKIAAIGKTMHWPEVGRQYLALLAEVSLGEAVHSQI